MLYMVVIDNKSEILFWESLSNCKMCIFQQKKTRNPKKKSLWNKNILKNKNVAQLYKDTQKTLIPIYFVFNCLLIDVAFF